ncbi:MAG: hypothetical protein IPM35_01255 [Myxococcales bacterium]|nr:hypothetical protein [Myxococcales bacterium]
MRLSVAPNRPARVQASTVRVRQAFAESRFGATAPERLRREASPELRALLASKDSPPGGWVPFALFVEVNQLVDRQFGSGDGSLIWESGRFAASHNAGVWKSLIMRHVTPGMLVGLASSLWSKHYEGGRLVSRSAGGNTLMVSIVDFPEPHPAHCKAIGGWMLGSIELGPRKDPAVQELACRANGAAICEFRLTWT